MLITRRSLVQIQPPQPKNPLNCIVKKYRGLRFNFLGPEQDCAERVHKALRST